MNLTNSFLNPRRLALVALVALAAVLAACGSDPTPTPAPSTGSGGSQPTPTPAPATVAEPAGRFSAGESAVVAGTDSCLNIRAQASIESEVIECLADGTIVTVLEGPVEQGNLTWWLIAAPTVNGWAADLYLATP